MPVISMRKSIADSIERWVEIHGHESMNFANLITGESNEEELKTYVWLMLNLISEEEAIDIVRETNRGFGDDARGRDE